MWKRISGAGNTATGSGRSGKNAGGDYTVKYVLDLEVVPVITEVRIYRGKEGTAAIGEEYRSDVCYGEKGKGAGSDAVRGKA